MATQVTRVVTRTFMFGCALIAGVAGPLSAAHAEFANPEGVAVVIGNRIYTGDIPEVDFAHRDAEGFKRYVVDVLGFDPENVIDLRDATQAEMWSTFGSRTTANRSELWSYLDPDGRSDVVVFYSGHGAPGLEDKRGYLLPVNADPDTAELNGYPIDVLYENLSNLKEARSVAVYLDACFSGASGGGGMLIQSASPVYIGAALPEQAGERLSVLTAATGEQIASWDRKAGHGLFTHHLLDALYGKGDADADGQVTAREAKAYLDRHMTRAARRTYKRRQRASFTGNADTVLVAAAGGGFPDRPVLALVEARPAAEGMAAGGKEAPPAPGGEQVAVAAPAPAVLGTAAAPAPVSVGTPKEVEAGLGLVRDELRLIQRGLAATGEDVGRPDGIFGPRTRKAIRGWQGEKGYPLTGFLTGEQVVALRELGEELAAESKRREGERLAEAERAAKERREAADEEAYLLVKSFGTVDGYNEYLAAFPRGQHVAEGASRARGAAPGRSVAAGRGAASGRSRASGRGAAAKGAGRRGIRASEERQHGGELPGVPGGVSAGPARCGGTGTSGPGACG